MRKFTLLNDHQHLRRSPRINCTASVMQQEYVTHHKCLSTFCFRYQDREEKQFIYRHSRTVFDLLDEDGSQTISALEFENFGFVFNFKGQAIKKIFAEFDVSGDKV